MEGNSGKEYSQPVQSRTKKKYKETGLYDTKTFMYADTKLQNRVYSFRSSRERTASMTARGLSSVPVQKLITKYSRNLSAEDIRGSVDAFEKSSTRRRSSCSRADSQQVMSRMVQRKSFATAFQNAKIKEAGYQTGK